MPANTPERKKGSDPQGQTQSVSRVRKPTLDEMTVGRTEVPVDKPLPASPRLQQPRQSHADEWKSDGRPPIRTVEIKTEPEKKARRGRPKKTGRPGA